MKRRRIQPRKTHSATTILLMVVLICITGFAGYYFGVLKRTHLTDIELSHQLPMDIEKSRQITATGRFSDNSSRDITHMVTWSSSDIGIAVISNMKGTQGIVHGKSAGQAIITARDPNTGVTGATRLKVMEADLVSISLTPAESTITIGQKQQLTAIGAFSDGKKKEITPSVIWGSSASSIAFPEDPVGRPGLMASAAPGSTIITAKDPKTGVMGTTSLTVSEATLVSYALSPDNLTTALGADLAITATGTFSDGSTRDITAELLWASSNQSVVRIDDSAAGKGVIHTRSVGSAVITATDPETGLTASSTVAVTTAGIVSLSILQRNPSVPLGENLQFTVRGKYTDGSSRILKGAVAWSSSNPAVAAFHADKNQKGLVRSITTGTTQITATDPKTGISASTDLTVIPAKLISYEISPRFPSLALGKSQQLEVNGIFTDQSRKNLTAASTWSVANPSIAEISNTPGKQGLITSLSAGSTTIHVKDTETGGSTTTTLVVTDAEMVSMTVSPDHAVIPLGQNKQLTATGILSDGSKVDVTQDVNWMSSNLSVALVGNTSGQKGTVFSKSIGVSIITIQEPSSGIKGSSKVSITGKELVSINIETDSLEIPLGADLTLKAIGLFSDGSREDITESGSWSSETPAVITVMNSPGKKGKVTAASMGMTSITFTDAPSENRKTISLSVTAARLKSIRIDPISPVIYLGDLQQFKAIGEFTDGTGKDMTESVEWHSSDPTLASIRNNPGRKGLATALAVGSSIITAIHLETKITGKADITGRVNW
ncbi:MAG: hypothetical protein C4522_16385 [Desulfobacteraceae bacterium]|nr:MAG: hypothetical protein C4522_16385 [Desulfobacteraceae bacterium]